jgi:hypothetical protein
VFIQFLASSCHLELFMACSVNSLASSLLIIKTVSVSVLLIYFCSLGDSSIMKQLSSATTFKRHVSEAPTIDHHRLICMHSLISASSTPGLTHKRTSLLVPSVLYVIKDIPRIDTLFLLKYFSCHSTRRRLPFACCMLMFVLMTENNE